MRGLTVVVAEANPSRLRTALLLALAQAALDGRARLFLDARAVPALRLPIGAEDDDAYGAAGQPALARLVDDALDAGVEITLCQTGLQLAGLEAHALDPRLLFGGIVGLLASLGDDRLVTL